MNKPRCAECDYLQLNTPYKSWGVRRECFCGHPEAYEAAKALNQVKMPGFIAFTEKVSNAPRIKTRPKWCPLMKAKEEKHGND